MTPKTEGLDLDLDLDDDEEGAPMTLQEELDEELEKRDAIREDFAAMLTASVPIHTERLRKAKRIALIGRRKSRSKEDDLE